MIKKTALAASITVALAGVSLPASSAILGTAAEGLLVPVFTHGLLILDDTVVQVTTPANIGFDGVPNNFTAPNTTPSSAEPTLDAVYAAYKDGSGNSKSSAINWFWFDEYSDKKYDGSKPVTADDVTELRASVIVPGAKNRLGYLVVASAAAKANPNGGANISMFGRAWAELDESRPPDGVIEDRVELPVLGLTDGPDNGLKMPTKQDNIKYAGVAQAPIVSPLVTGIRTNVSNDTLAAQTVFDLEIAAAGLNAVHMIWLDQNRALKGSNFEEACEVPAAPGSIGGYIFDTEEKKQSWGDCVPWELSKIWVETNKEQGDFPGVNLANGGFIQYILPEYQDDPALGDGPQSAGYAFALVQKAAGDWILSLANERGQYNDGCGNNSCVPKP
jgi:hypothetical protein